MRAGRRPLTRLALVIVLSGLIFTSRSAVAQTPSGAVGILYVGPDDAISKAIDLAAPHIVRVDRPNLAQVIVINNSSVGESGSAEGTSLSVETLREYGDLVRQPEIGLVVFCGESYPQRLTDLAGLLGVGAFGLAESGTPAEAGPSLEEDPLQQVVAWSSAPPITARTLITNPNLLIPIVTTELSEPILQRVRGRENGQILLVGAWLAHPSNAEWQDWPYFRYLIYHLVMDAAASSRILRFSDYAVSPVPPRQMRVAFAGAGIGIIAVAGALFYLARRNLFLHPDEGQIPAAPPSLPPTSDWDAAGFHRLLAGALTYLPYGLVLAIPLIAYETTIVPGLLFSNSQVYGFWTSVTRWMALLWVLLDFGTGTAATWYFSIYQQRYPQQAYRYFQFYVWWQLLSGAAFAGMMGIVTALVVPGTPIAHLAFYLAVASMQGLLRSLNLFHLYFRAIQRLDYERIVTLTVSVVTVVAQIAAVAAFRRWGATQPAIGQGIGGVLGMGVGLYVAQWAGFLLGLLYATRARYPIRELIRPRFNNSIAQQVLGYGAQLTFGQLAIPAGALLEMMLITRWTGKAWAGDWVLLVQVAALYEFLLHDLYRGLMPAMAVAITFGHKTLQRYYVSMAWRYSAWLCLLLVSVASALGPRLLTEGLGGTGPAAPEYLLSMLAWGAARWIVWLADRIFEAARRPAVTSWLTIGEVGLRVGVALALAPRLGMGSIVLGYFVGLGVRSLVAWVLLQRSGLGAHVYVWQSLVAPAGSALLIYEVLRLVSEQGAPSPAHEVILWTIGATLVGLVAHGFLTGILGGWDDGGLKELERAGRISGIGALPAWVLLQAVRLGTRLSPLRERFPIRVRDLAAEEAAAVTYSRSPGA